MKSVLVTGAAKRIGRAIALNLAKTGWSVAVHCNRSIDEAGQLVDHITEFGGVAAIVVADLAIEEEAAGLIRKTNETIGPISCLVNNASVFEKDTLETERHIAKQRSASRRKSRKTALPRKRKHSQRKRRKGTTREKRRKL